MNIRTMHILIGIFFAVAGIVTLFDGVHNMRMSNLLIGICYMAVAGLYFARKKEKQ